MKRKRNTSPLIFLPGGIDPSAKRFGPLFPVVDSEHRAGVVLRAEGLQILGLLPQPQEIDRDLQLTVDSHQRPAAARPVQLGHHQPGQPVRSTRRCPFSTATMAKAPNIPPVPLASAEF